MDAKAATMEVPRPRPGDSDMVDFAASLQVFWIGPEDPVDVIGRGRSKKLAPRYRERVWTYNLRSGSALLILRSLCNSDYYK